MQESRDTLRTPAEHGRSVNINSPSILSDSDVGQSFFPPDFTADAFVSTPVATEPPLEQERTLRSRRGWTSRWVKFVLIWILVALSIIFVHFGIEQIKN